MAGKVVDSGPMMDWTRDNQIYTRYRMWKAKVELHFSSIYADYSNGAEVSLPQTMDGR